MKAWMIAGSLLFSAIAAAQGNGTFDSTRKLWNGDWLATQLDQMVHGEEFMGFPGPLPKFLFALGKDHRGPAVDFELQFNVDRDAVYWSGQCNGWAGAVINHDPPKATVINGVKLYSGDLKAILATIYRDGQVAQFARKPGGLTPGQLDGALSGTLGQGGVLIVDVDLSEQTWNFPVAGYSRSARQEGDWTVVSLSVGYVDTEDMARYDVQPPAVQFFDYVYRYQTATNSGHEWIGGALESRPERAWIPVRTYGDEVWNANSNRYFNLNTYEQLMAQADHPDAAVDIYEPNDDMASAFIRDSPLILGSSLPGDVDFYEIFAAKNEVIEFEFMVYDGPAVDVALFDRNGNLMGEWNAIEAEDVAYLPQFSQQYYVGVFALDEEATSFYRLVFPEHNSLLQADAPVKDEIVSWRAVNRGGDPIQVSGLVARDLPGDGSINVAELGESRDYRSTGDVIWARRAQSDRFIEKRYEWNRDVQASYIVPHLTFKNGWTTQLEITVEDGADEVTLEVYRNTGQSIEEVSLPVENGRFIGSIRPYLAGISVAQGSWFELSGARIQGHAIYEREMIGDFARIPIESKPTVGEVAVFDLTSSDQGWTGIAAVNTSGIDNQVMYRLVDDGGDILTDGILMLAPGEKWLSTVAGITDQARDGYSFMMFSQYEMNALVIQNRYDPHVTYGHRMLSFFADTLWESYMTVEEDWDESVLMIANLNSRNTHVLFEGYDELGNLHGRFHTILGRTLAPYEVRVAPVSQIMDNGVDLGDLSAIRHFRVLAFQPVYVLEFSTIEGEINRTATGLRALYSDP